MIIRFASAYLVELMLFILKMMFDILRKNKKVGTRHMILDFMLFLSYLLQILALQYVPVTNMFCQNSVFARSLPIIHNGFDVLAAFKCEYPEFFFQSFCTELEAQSIIWFAAVRACLERKHVVGVHCPLSSGLAQRRFEDLKERFYNFSWMNIMYRNEI